MPAPSGPLTASRDAPASAPGLLPPVVRGPLAAPSHAPDLHDVRVALLDARAAGALDHVAVLYPALVLVELGGALPDVLLRRIPPRADGLLPGLRDPLHGDGLLHVAAPERLRLPEGVEGLLRRELQVYPEGHVDDLGVRLVLLLLLLGLLLRRLLVLLPGAQLSEALAHLREGVLGRLVGELLRGLDLRDQLLRLRVGRVHLHDALEVAEGLDVLVAREVGLGPPEDRLHVVGVGLQHLVAAHEARGGVAQQEEARGLVELRGVLHVRPDLLALLRPVVRLAHEVLHLPVLVQGQLEALLLEELGSHVLPRHGRGELVLVVHAPDVRGLLALDELEREDHLLSGDILQPDLGLLALRGGGGDQGPLADLHVNDGRLDGVANLPVAADKGQRGGLEARQGDLVAVGGRLNLHRRLVAVAGLLVVVGVPQRLLHDAEVLLDGDVADLVDVLEGQLDLDLALALDDVAALAEKHALLVLDHALEALVHGRREGP
mmetsp:Transcript_66840/g.196203  ORF Transcript_66840/g.196203 Transcript_66840/m.196203 type:complete len:492 (+) Transcript_66840:28-1503(+)